MPKFIYKIEDPQGKMVDGVMEAPSEERAHRYLTEHQYQVHELKMIRKVFSFETLLAKVETVNPTQFNFFVRQLATLLKAGVPILTCLKSLSGEIQGKLLREAVESVYRDVEKGDSFSMSIARHPKVFNTLFIATICAGEAIGELDTALFRLADILYREYQTQAKIKASLRYPFFVFIVMVIAFLIATLYIIPRFKGLFDTFGGKLPLPTQILMGLSDVMTNYWFLVLIGAVGIGVAVFYHYRTYKGRRFWDGVLLKAGFVGLFIRQSIFSSFARMLGMMLKSGVDILQSLELVASIAGNSVISDSIRRVRDQVSQGEAMSVQMKREGVFPTLLIQLVTAGEASGKMDELLMQIAEYYDLEIDLMAKNMESLIEPIFVLMLGFFVAVMALGIFLPMWNLYSLIQTQAGS